MQNIIQKDSKIAVLCGGMSSEREISLRSGKNCLAALHRLGYNNAEIVDVYEAMDMFLPGHFGYLSAMNNNQSYDIPDLRDKAEREKWRNDTECTAAKVAGDMLVPSYSKGNPEIPAEVYENLKKKLEQ